jgi:hypothetical protein
VAPNVAELIDRAAAADDVRELFSAASTRPRRLVPFDSAAWLATDPATSLPTSPARPCSACGSRWSSSAR